MGGGKFDHYNKKDIHGKSYNFCSLFLFQKKEAKNITVTQIIFTVL